MAFPIDEVQELLARCHRRCCICHRFCGVKIETDHIEQRGGDSGSDNIHNAIPVCFECHAEIHAYNDRHPRGRKYRPEELRQHREQWLKICEDKPEVFRASRRDPDVGPLQALIDELEFNCVLLGQATDPTRARRLHDAQFRRAIQEGLISVLQEELKDQIMRAYAAIVLANDHIGSLLNVEYHRRAGWDGLVERSIRDAKPLVDNAHRGLLALLSSEGTDSASGDSAPVRSEGYRA